ncbi:MAG: hypothetical protein KatS3mg111_3668 [Pirellulaceae bacterium]|nr:MAG: hypothetical protein KatS3mg111_3668 [Pirellulaceae bacterium]
MERAVIAGPGFDCPPSATYGCNEQARCPASLDGID